MDFLACQWHGQERSIRGEGRFEARSRLRAKCLIARSQEVPPLSGSVPRDFTTPSFATIFFFNTISVPKKCLFEFRRIDNDTMLARHLDWFANLWRGQLCDQSCCAEYLPSVGSVDCIEKINLAFTNDQTLCREFQRYAFYFEVLEVECTLLSCFRSHKKIQKK